MSGRKLAKFCEGRTQKTLHLAPSCQHNTNEQFLRKISQNKCKPIFFAVKHCRKAQRMSERKLAKFCEGRTQKTLHLAPSCQHDTSEQFLRKISQNKHMLKFSAVKHRRKPLRMLERKLVKYCEGRTQESLHLAPSCQSDMLSKPTEENEGT